MRADKRRANRVARKRIRARAHARAWVFALYSAGGTQLFPWQVAQLVTYLAGPDPRAERANRNRMIHYVTAPRRAGKRRGVEIAHTIIDELRGAES